MSAIVERIIDGEKWWVDSESGKTYGLCCAVDENRARTRHARHQKRAAKAPPILESHIEGAIVQAMELDGWRAIKMEENFSERKKKKTGEPGMSDHLFLRYHNAADPRGPVPYTKTRCYNPLGDILWWEFKRVRGDRQKAEQLSADQLKWIHAERSRGALVWVAGADHAATIAGAALHYLESGLCRRREVFERLAHG